MQKGEQREKEALKLKADLAIKQIKGEDDYQSSDSEQNEKPLINSSGKFGVKALQQKSPKQEQFQQLDQDKVIKAARRLAGNQGKEDSDSSSDDDAVPVKKEAIEQTPKDDQNLKSSLKKGTKQQKKGAVAVAFDVESDLKAFNTEKA